MIIICPLWGLFMCNGFCVEGREVMEWETEKLMSWQTEIVQKTPIIFIKGIEHWGAHLYQLPTFQLQPQMGLRLRTLESLFSFVCKICGFIWFCLTFQHQAHRATLGSSLWGSYWLKEIQTKCFRKMEKNMLTANHNYRWERVGWGEAQRHAHAWSLW